MLASNHGWVVWQKSSVMCVFVVLVKYYQSEMSAVLCQMPADGSFSSQPYFYPVITVMDSNEAKWIWNGREWSTDCRQFCHDRNNYSPWSKWEVKSKLGWTSTKLSGVFVWELKIFLCDSSGVDEAFLQKVPYLIYQLNGSCSWDIPRKGGKRARPFF